MNAPQPAVLATTNRLPRQLNSAPPPLATLPKLRVNGVANIACRVTETGLQVKIADKTLTLHYPPTIWQRFPKVHRQILAENIAFALTFHLPYLYPSLEKVSYNIPVPLSEPFLFKGFAYSLPSTAIMQTHKDKRTTSNLFRRLLDVDYTFSNRKTDIPPYNRTSMSDQAIMPFTFGKESLLTFALSRELGINVHPVFISEPYYPYEVIIKKLLAKSFKKEYRVQLAFLKNNLGILREPVGWFGWEMQLTQYSMMLLPYVYAKRAGYLLFSNEQSCNDTIIDEDGFRCNPVYEQSHAWLLQNSLMASIVGGNSLSIGTLVEPLYELAIMRILHKRYPQIAKYQSSCDLEKKPNSSSRWCQACSKCGRVYAFLLAIGVDPKRVGFTRNLMSARYQSLFTIFESTGVRAYGYDQSEAGKDEQIFAFYLAYKRGVRGPLMTKFVRKYLKYAKHNAKAFRKKFFGIHSHRTVPAPFKAKVLRIFHQELDRLAHA
jgi:hypothetical protein